MLTVPTWRFARRVARAHQELDAAKVSDPESEEAHQILRHIYFPGWKHRHQLTHVRQLLQPCWCSCLSERNDRSRPH